MANEGIEVKSSALSASQEVDEGLMWTGPGVYPVST
jgi:hypothetical protein